MSTKIYATDGLQVSTFYGGKELGRCVQFTIIGDKLKGYASIPVAEAIKLGEQLRLLAQSSPSNSPAGTAPSKESKSV